MISVIVPVYNAEMFLPRCIDSILSQTYKDFELLLIDDGSVDSSSFICDDYAKKDSRIKVFHKENGGVSSARNIGVDIAQGKWICFIDSDDYISPNYFSSIEKCNSDIILFNNKRIHLDGNVYIEYKVAQCKSKDIEDYMRILCNNLTNPVMKVPWAKMIRRDCIGDLRFKIGQTIGEDTLFVLDVLAYCKSIEVNNDCSYYWQDEDNGGDVVKYQQTPQKSAEYLSNIYLSYKRLGVKSTEFEVFLISFFYSLCQKAGRMELNKWYENKEIKEIERQIIACNPKLLPDNYWLYPKSYMYKFFYILSRKMHSFMCSKIR